MALLDDLKSFLVLQGIQTSSWPIYLGHMPAEPVQNITLTETGGLDPDPDGDVTQTMYDVLTFQVRVRGSTHSYVATRQKAQDIYEVLHDPVTLPSGFVYILATQAAPIPTGYDVNDSPNFSQNYRAMRER